MYVWGNCALQILLDTITITYTKFMLHNSGSGSTGRDFTYKIDWIFIKKIRTMVIC